MQDLWHVEEPQLGAASPGYLACCWKKTCCTPLQGAAWREDSTAGWPARVGAPCGPPKALPCGLQGRDPSLAAVVIRKFLLAGLLRISHLKTTFYLATPCSSSTASPRAGTHRERDISLCPREGMLQPSTDLLLPAIWGPQPHRTLPRAPLVPAVPSPGVSSCPSQGRGEGDPAEVSQHPAAQHSSVLESPRPAPSQLLPLDSKVSSSTGRAGLQRRAVPTGSLAH